MDRPGLLATYSNVIHSKCFIQSSRLSLSSKLVSKPISETSKIFKGFKPSGSVLPKHTNTWPINKFSALP